MVVTILFERALKLTESDILVFELWISLSLSEDVMDHKQISGQFKFILLNLGLRPFDHVTTSKGGLRDSVKK